MKTIIHKPLFCSILLTVFFISNDTLAQNSGLKVKEIPYPLEFKNNPTSFIVNDTLVQLSAESKTNLFNNPNGITRVQNAPLLLFEPKGDFTLSAKVSGNLKSIYDVAALVIY
ncbi:MAG: DUF1349 domain-containing protein, partial [Paludibacter sp.]|nr:DUF1349 domain-containing protein [Paludibacter sp.]